MTRKQRTRVLVLGDPSLRKALADEIRTLHRVEMVQKPRVGLVMATVRESARRSLFHLGEVLVTEAKARIAEFSGLGLIRGRDEEAAWDLAVVDAAWSAGLPVTKNWADRLKKAEERLESDLHREQADLASTRVSFETMDQAGLT